jgi:hypothetical protein
MSKLHIQLPPHIRTVGLVPSVRLTSKQSLENNASQAVAAANGTVAASAREMESGTTKQIRSSASVYSL